MNNQTVTQTTDRAQAPAINLKDSYREAAAWNLFAMAHHGNGLTRWSRLSEAEKQVYRQEIDRAFAGVRHLQRVNA